MRWLAMLSALVALSACGVKAPPVYKDPNTGEPVQRGAYPPEGEAVQPAIGEPEL